MHSREIRIGNIVMGGGNPIVVQTMCDTRTSDVDASFAQCVRLYERGAQLIRLTVPTMRDVEALSKIKLRLRAEGMDVPLVADVHFSPDIAIAAASAVEKVRINPGNFHKDFSRARALFARLIEVCKDNGTALRIGLNHGSLGERITNLYGDTPLGMKNAAMEWIGICAENDFYNVCVSLKASNTFVMTQAYRLLAAEMEKTGLVLPLHLGVTEAGNGDAGRMKSVVGISALLSEGIGDTVRVSLTEPPENELEVARYLADRYSHRLYSTLSGLSLTGRKAVATYYSPSRERLLMDFAADFGKKLLDKDLDEVELRGCYLDESGRKVDLGSAADEGWSGSRDMASGSRADTARHLTDELMQAARRRFYRPEYIACPGCGRTMYNLQETFEEVKRRTSHMQGMVIAVMGCIVNGPGEMADADWGYVGEGAGKVSIYHGRTPLARHIPENEAIDKLLELIEFQNGSKPSRPRQSDDTTTI